MSKGQDVDEAIKKLIASYDCEEGIPSDTDTAIVELVAVVWGKVSADELIKLVDACEDKYFVDAGQGSATAEAVFSKKV